MDRHRIEVEGDTVTSGGGRLARIERDIPSTAKRRTAADRWNPPFCGDLDMRIAADGTWHYRGSPITRERMVALFASVLRRGPDGAYCLVTPVEKFRIRVDDAPFVAVEMRVEGSGRGQRLTFRSNVGDSAAAGPDHRLRFERAAPLDGFKPYIHMRDGLDALVSRALVYDLVDLAEEHEVGGEPFLGVWSDGSFFAMARADGALDL